MARPNNAAAIDQWKANLRAAKEAFQALPEIVREQTLEAVETTAQLIAAGAKQRIVASPSIVTRSLLNAIDWRVTKTNGRGRVGVTAGSSTVQTSANFAKGVIQGRKVKVKGFVVAGPSGGAAGGRLIRPSRYAHLVEFGAAHMPPEPFMIPAAEAEKGPHLDRVKRAGTAIERDVAAIGNRFL